MAAISMSTSESKCPVKLYVVRITGAGLNIAGFARRGTIETKSPGVHSTSDLSESFKLVWEGLDLTARTSCAEQPDPMQYFPVEFIKFTMQGVYGPCTVRMVDALVHIETDGPLLKDIIDSKRVGHGVFSHRTVRGAAIECDITHHKEGIELLREYGMLHHSGRARNKHGVVPVSNKLYPAVKSFGADRPQFAYGILPGKTSLIYMLGNNGEPIAFPRGVIYPIGTLKVNRVEKKFSSLTKLASILQYCRTQFTDNFRVRVNGSSRMAKIEISYTPATKCKGKITLTFMNRDIPDKSRSVSVAHFIGVIKRNSSLSEESNKRILGEWWDRDTCPHKDWCPRNCAKYVKEVCGLFEIPRWPTPDHVKCSCKAEVSRFHYDIEIGRGEPKPLDGIMADLVHMYDTHPRMFRDSRLGILFRNDRYLLEHISEYVFGPYTKPKDPTILGPA